MKKRILAITAFMAVALAGCGQINEPLTTTDSNDKPASKIEIQTEIHSDPVTSVTITETEKTSAAQPTTEKTSMETTSDVSLSETQAEDSTMNVISENNDTPQPQAEEKQSPQKRKSLLLLKVPLRYSLHRLRQLMHLLLLIAERLTMCSKSSIA